MTFVESEVVELKAAVVGDICKEVIAFANTKEVCCILVSATMETSLE